MDLLSSSLFILSLILLSLIKTLILKKKKLPPGPYGFPLIGSLITLGDRPHESLANLAKTYGPLMTVKLGLVKIAVASSTETAMQILQKNDQAFLGRPVPHAVTAQNGHELTMAWIPGGPHWKKLRKICTSQVFTTQRLDALQYLRQSMMNNMIEHISSNYHGGKGVDIGRLVFGTALNLLSNTAFSENMFDLESKTMMELKVLVGKIMELAGKPNLADYFHFLKPFDPQGIHREIKVSYDRLQHLLDDIIDRRIQRRSSQELGDKCGDLLDVLLDYTEGKSTESLHRLDVKLLLTELFIWGTDTTSTTVEWIMAELLHNPVILSKAKQEIMLLKIAPGLAVQEQDISQLPYLRAIIKETMRLHPTSPLLLPHRAQEEVELMGYTIAKHTQIFVNVWSIFTDTEYWDEPMLFKPERFIDSENYDYRGRDFSFIPFGAGRRICPGLNLAVRMVSLIVATLVHNFDWKLPNGMLPEDMDMTDKFGVTLKKAESLIAIPVGI